MKIIFLGIIQGLTEFLPISSSGHLYIFKKILNLPQDLMPFFVFLHLSTLLVIFVFLRKEIIFLLFKKKIFISIVIITFITGIVGLLIKYFFKVYFESKFLIPILLFINGCILLSVKKETSTRNALEINIKDSIIIGLLQGLAIFPGISRSGMTIVGLLKRGFKPKEAFSLSFLMVIPLILLVQVYEFKNMLNFNFPLRDVFLSFIAAFGFGMLALVVIRRTLINEKFYIFGYYCMIMSLLSLVF